MNRQVFRPPPLNRWTSYESKSDTDWLEIERAGNLGMQRLMMVVALVATGPAIAGRRCVYGDPLTVASDFEEASVREVEVDEAARSISFMPGGDLPNISGRWHCYWQVTPSAIDGQRRPPL